MSDSSCLYGSNALFKLTVKSMSLLGLTLFTVALTATVAIILAFCTTFLIKTKSSRRNKSALEKEFEESTKAKKIEESTKTKKIEESTKAKKNPNEKPGSAVKTQEAPEEPSESVQNLPHTDTREDRKKEPVKEKKKSFFIFGKTSFEGCPHEFGHLRNLPKNAPIPDECFGCSQILECLGHSS